MQYSNFLFGLIWAMGVCARYNHIIENKAQISGRDASVDEITSPRDPQDWPKLSRDPSQLRRNRVNRRDTVSTYMFLLCVPVPTKPWSSYPRYRPSKYPINCYLHNWPSASVESVRQAYSWFYQLWAPLEADAQHCRRVACFGVSAVWLCADSLGYQKPNSVKVADKMNELLDGNNGCLDAGNPRMVQGQVFTSEEWSVLVRGGENCSVEPLEQPIFY
ncbi:hypothetical protein F5Y12DRAFT_797899 [Xylaria sp. FL1777]|nr:hypothetical protein F5Y12DRAFT_797899 [Xylaria sp. FL1777]